MIMPGGHPVHTNDRAVEIIAEDPEIEEIKSREDLIFPISKKSLYNNEHSPNNISSNNNSSKTMSTPTPTPMEPIDDRLNDDDEKERVNPTPGNNELDDFNVVRQKEEMQQFEEKN